MSLGSRRCGEADENYDAIAARILTDGVDVEIGFPVVNGPNVAGLIDDYGRLTHHWYEAGRRRWWTVQRLAVVQKHLAARRRDRVASGR